MNLGSYSKISEVWAKYPEGGKEGDTVVVGTTTFKWDKYSQNWVSGDGEIVTAGYDVGSVSGDLHVSRHQVIGGDETVRGSSLVKKDLKVEGTLYARIKGADKGLFPSLDRLKSNYPKAVEGDYAVIGEKIPGPIYRYDGKNWIDTGEIGGNGGTIDLEDYYNKEVVDVRTNEINISRLYPTGGLNGTEKYTLEMAIAGVPLELRKVGIKCSFLNEGGTVETWEYQGGVFAATNSWTQGGAQKVAELTNQFSGINFNRGALFDRNLKEGLTALKKISSNKIIDPLFEQGSLKFDDLVPATNRVRSSVLIEIAKAPLIFQLSSGFEIGVFEYNSNGVFDIFSNYLSGGQYNPQSELVRFTMRKSDDSDITPKEAYEAIQINGYLIEYASPPTAEQVNAIYGNLIVDLIKNTGSINAINGKIEPAHTNNFYSKINITGFTKINSQVFKTGGEYGSAFFDENDNYISGVYFIDAITGNRKDYDIPTNASYMLFSYMADEYATANRYPLFDYVELKGIPNKKYTLSGLDKRMTVLEEGTGFIYRPRPSSGVESFTVEVNGDVALLDTDAQKGDGYIEMTDYGIIQLPTNYLQSGNPVPLVVVCHGAGASFSQYLNPVVTAGKVMGDPAKFLVQKGYACFDMFANPTQWSGSTSELHYGSPLVLQCYKKGYEHILKNYNVEKTALYVSGSSMGGLASFQIVQSRCFPVKAHAGFCPVIDVFKQAYCNPWAEATYQRKKIAEYFRFYDWQAYEGAYDVDYFKANMEKLIGYYPIIKNLVTGDYMKLFEVIPSNPKVQTDNSEEILYSQFISIHPVPVKVWHNWNDTVVTCRYSKYWIDMVRRSGQLAFFRSFSTGVHNAWDNGETVNEKDIDGNAITTHVSQYECWLWFERFR